MHKPSQKALYLISTKTVAAAAAVKVKGQEEAKLTPRRASKGRNLRSTSGVGRCFDKGGLH